MPSKKEILNLLLETGYLWEDETRHEAMLLYKSLYANVPDIRDTIIDYVLKGPPQINISDERRSQDWKGHEIFELLAYLQENDLPLTDKAEKFLKEIRQNHPDWRLPADADIASPMYTEWHRNPYTIDDIHSKSPSEVAKMLEDHKKTLGSNLRDFSETVGLTCREYPEWCLEFFEYLRKIVNSLPKDMMELLMWGMRLTEEGNKTKWDVDSIKQLMSILDDMLEERPDAEFWKSFPRLIESWQKKFKTGPVLWGKIARRLSNIYTSFDYQGEQDDKPVDWISKDHPFGVLTEIYLGSAYETVLRQSQTGSKYDIEKDTFLFFEYALQNYADGTRYGICILANWLSWLEAVASEWTERNLIPVFSWSNKERALVAWSGYLWSRGLSRNLGMRFNDTYLEAVRHYNSFDESEKEGLIVHVAGLIWFKQIDIESLKEFVKYLDEEGRLKLLEMWELHLEKAGKDVAEKFFRTVTLPYWDWCKVRYAQSSTDNERFSFWKLLPFSYDIFPKAAQKAINFAPAKIDHVNLFPKQLAETNLGASYPEEFTNFLIAFMKADPNPLWHKEEWEQLWDSIKMSGAKNLQKLKDELARKQLEFG